MPNTITATQFREHTSGPNSMERCEGGRSVCVLTFLPFFVGRTCSTARLLKACLTACRTKGSCAICMATMCLAPWRTASGVEKWLEGRVGRTHKYVVRTCWEGLKQEVEMPVYCLLPILQILYYSTSTNKHKQTNTHKQTDRHTHKYANTHVFVYT